MITGVIATSPIVGNCPISLRNNVESGNGIAKKLWGAFTELVLRF